MGRMSQGAATSKHGRAGIADVALVVCRPSADSEADLEYVLPFRALKLRVFFSSPQAKAGYGCSYSSYHYFFRSTFCILTCAADGRGRS